MATINICAGCGGKGKIKCPLCKGKGTITKRGNLLGSVECHGCNGVGEILCKICGGVGKTLDRPDRD